MRWKRGRGDKQNKDNSSVVGGGDAGENKSGMEGEDNGGWWAKKNQGGESKKLKKDLQH